MKSIKKYPTASGMRMALEQRLKKVATDTNKNLERLRRHVAFDRFLARLFSSNISGLIAKGGYTLELRLDKARTTKDIDFSFTGDLGGQWKGKPENLQEFLFTCSQIDLHDYFEYVIGKATLGLENAPYGGYRYPIQARMAGRIFAKFSIDIAAGDVWYEPHDKLKIHDWFDFAGLPVVEIPVISTEQQFAEKLHSYTQQREHPNSRVKDIVDMVLLIKKMKMSEERLIEITQKTFTKRLDSVFPPMFNAPPDDWYDRYPDIAGTCGLSESLNEAVSLVRDYCEKCGLIQQ
jgi:predicted nucleotidyltransferase component of viral defense system